MLLESYDRFRVLGGRFVVEMRVSSGDIAAVGTYMGHRTVSDYL